MRDTTHAAGGRTEAGAYQLMGKSGVLDEKSSASFKQAHLLDVNWGD